MRDLTENRPEARPSGHDGMICECRRCRARRADRYVERLADRSLSTALRHAQDDPSETATEDVVAQLLEAEQTEDGWEVLGDEDGSTDPYEEVDDRAPIRCERLRSQGYGYDSYDSALRAITKLPREQRWVKQSKAKKGPGAGRGGWHYNVYRRRVGKRIDRDSDFLGTFVSCPCADAKGTRTTLFKVTSRVPGREGHEAIYGAADEFAAGRAGGGCGCRRCTAGEETVERLARESLSVVLRDAQEVASEASDLCESAPSVLMPQESVCLAAVIKWNRPVDFKTYFDGCFKSDCDVNKRSSGKCELPKGLRLYQFIRKSDGKILYTGRAINLYNRIQGHCRNGLKFAKKKQLSSQEKSYASNRIDWEIQKNKGDLLLRWGFIKAKTSFSGQDHISCSVRWSDTPFLQRRSLLAAVEKLYHSFDKEEIGQGDSERFEDEEADDARAW